MTVITKYEKEWKEDHGRIKIILDFKNIGLSEIQRTGGRDPMVGKSKAK